MSTCVIVATPQTTLATAASLMAHHDIGFLPIVDESRPRVLVGAVTDRDLVVQGLADGLKADAPLASFLDPRPVVVARETMEVHELLGLMARHHVHHLPVLSANDMLVGVVSMGDLVQCLGPLEPTELVTLAARRVHPFADRPVPVGGNRPLPSDSSPPPPTAG